MRKKFGPIKVISILAMLIVVAVIAVMITTLSGYNKLLIDTQMQFSYGIICLPDGSIVKGEIQNWTDFEDGDQLQITIKGITYLVHSTDAVLMSEKR